jgi:OPA family sugar phosphate sensor protein UhpC-like MFS transporter
MRGFTIPIRMSIFAIFKPASYISEITDPEAVNRSYKYWRIRTFYAMYIGYAFYYFTRQSFTFLTADLHLSLGLSKYELGMIGSILSLSYGASKFLGGMLGDKSNPRYFMAVGLIITGLANLMISVSSSWWAFAFFWGLNGCFQGWGAPGCTKLLTHWYSQSERGRWWSFWSTSQNLGGVIIANLVPFFASFFGWRIAMCVPGVLAILGGIFLIDRLRDTPQSLGLPRVEIFRKDISAAKAPKEKVQLPLKTILMDYILRNKYIWILAFSYFFVYVIRMGVNGWSMPYFMEQKGYSHARAGICVSCFEVGGFLGSLVAGWSSDLFFAGRRNPVNVIFGLGILFCLILFRFTIFDAFIVNAAFLFCFGFFIFGPQMLIGMAAAELSHKKAAATAVGFASCFAYLGAAFAGGPLGYIIEQWGWNGLMATLVSCATCIVLLLAPLWYVKTAPEKEVAQEETAGG